MANPGGPQMNTTDQSQHNGPPGPGNPQATPAANTTGSIPVGGGGNAAADVSAADTAAVGTNALALIESVLSDYGLQSLSAWAWAEITSGASSQQMLVDMYQTPQFKQRFPAIEIRQKAGLPPISPADYVNYEDSLAQMNHQYGLPDGFLTNPDLVTKLIGGDTSINEVQARVDTNGFQEVANASPEVRQFFTAAFGPSGDSALAAHFLDTNIALPLLEKQATAAQIGGTMAMGGINMNADTALKLASMGVTQGQASTQSQNLQQEQDLFNNSVTEPNGLEIGQQGVEAAFGLSAASTAAVTAREQEREAQFKGGGSGYSDQYGIQGAGQARTA